MSDWEIVEPDKQNSSDWEIAQPHQPEENESLLGSVVKAPFRVANDLVGSLAKGILATPQYAAKATTEVPGLLNLITQHPLRALAQGGAGLTELGHNLLNTPKAIGDYTADRLHLLPKSIAEKIPYQRDISQDINLTFGEPQQAGEELARGLVRNLPAIGGGVKIAPKLKAFNPAKLKAENIAKGIVETKGKMKEKYSGKKGDIENYPGLYNQLFNDAEKKGIKDLRDIVPKIDIETIRKYTPESKILGVEDFIKDSALRNAHDAKSDLLKIKNKLEEKISLTKAEQKQYKAVNDAINNIESNMFKIESGAIDSELLGKYLQIQKGYATEAIPYTKNKDIRAYQKNELLAPDLISRLSRGKFNAQRGKYHPEIKRRELMKKALIGAGLTSAGAVGKTLYDQLTRNRE